MDHVVYVEASSKEMDKLLNGSKTMILRGAAGRKLPHGRVSQGDMLYFTNNNGEGTIKAKASVKSVFNSEKLGPGESAAIIEQNAEKLQLSKKQLDRFSGKRYLVLIEVENTMAIEPVGIDKSAFSNMDDWLPVGNIEEVRVMV